jgi:quercetin dioxygenase-like cupin family protein
MVIASLLSEASLAQDVPRPVRTLIASARLASVAHTPMHFVVARIDLEKAQTVALSGAEGYLYLLSGRVVLSGAAEMRTLTAGEGAYVSADSKASMQNNGARAARLLRLSLVPATALGALSYDPTGKVTEMYRTAAAIPHLEAGPYEFSLTKVTSPPKVKPPLHHRSGAAIYYVLQGTGTLHMEAASEPRKAGAIQYEPNGFIHTWENSGRAPLVLLQVNLSREGAPEIIWLR